MKTIKTMIADSIAKIIISTIKQKSKILKEVIDNPNNIIIQTETDGEEIIVKVKKKS